MVYSTRSPPRLPSMARLLLVAACLVLACISTLGRAHMIELPPSMRECFYEQRHKDTGTYSFTATHSGRYTYCFSNEFSTVSDKTLSFNVHGIIYVADEGEMLPIEREIRDLAAGLQAVKDEHEYMVIRERTHRNTAESTNSRVKWWSIIQGFMLLGVCAVQVVFVKRHFEVRRAI